MLIVWRGRREGHMDKLNSECSVNLTRINKENKENFRLEIASKLISKVQ